MKLVKVGVWVWGAVTVLLAIAFLGIVIAAGFYIEPKDDGYCLLNAPHLLFGLFYSLKENGSLVAGILGFSGLAWSYFFKLNNHSL